MNRMLFEFQFVKKIIERNSRMIKINKIFQVAAKDVDLMLECSNVKGDSNVDIGHG